MEYINSKSLVLNLVLLLSVSANAIPITRSRGLAQAPSPSVSLSSVSSSSSSFTLMSSGLSQMDTKASGELAELCKDGENIKLCMDSLAPVVRGALDPVVAAVTEIGLTLNMTDKLINTISTLKADPKTSKGIMDALDICKDQYDSIVDTIKSCLELIHQNQVYEAYMQFSSVISYQQSCEDAFTESPGEVFPFANDSKMLYQLGGNCLAILMHMAGVTPFY